MITIVEKAVYLYLMGESEELHALAESFLFPHPHRDRIDIHKIWQRTGGEKGWDGLIGPIKIRRDHGEVLRGHKDAILARCKELDIDINPASQLVESPFSYMTVDDVPADLLQGCDFDLDENQRTIIAEWLQHGMGIGKIAVNGGKSAAFAGFAAFLKSKESTARLLYITDRERLVNQVDHEMSRFLPDMHITRYGGGSKDNSGKDMVISTLAMLRKHYDELVASGWFNSFIAVMFDESHHASAESSELIMTACAGSFFRIGASDTVREDNPIAQMQITGLLGPVRTVVAQSELIRVGRSAVPHIYVVDAGRKWLGKFRDVPYQALSGDLAWVLLDGSDEMRKGIYKGQVIAHDGKGNIVYEERRVLDGTSFKKVKTPKVMPGLHLIEIDGMEYEVDSAYCLLNRSVDKAIVQFKERNALVVEWAKHFSDKGKRTLVVATRTMHVLILETLLAEAVDPDLVLVATGETTAAQRNAIFDKFRSTPGAILISPLVKEGVSINEIEAGVIADYIGDYEYANQIVGRFLRRKKTGDNVAEIVWFIDRQQRRFEVGCMKVLKKMYVSQQDSFVFYWPVVHPEDLTACNVYGTKNDPVYALDDQPEPPKFLHV